ncbi:hypothetical protein [Luteimonas aquatica]|uniref:hypothetical protein n=1 Tax=Luteimonas aquatica TaxID=450364 RepID=UPI001F585596|nr:hypothetical protein [Luteimonas aquatica]
MGRTVLPPRPRPLPHNGHAALLQALAVSQAALAGHARALALALSELGDIDLPPGAPNAQDRAQLQAAAPLYFANELEAAGLLPTADLVAGLFASGAITQPLGPAAQQINAYWRGRRERLDANERGAIFARVFEAPHFERLMGAYCEALVAQADGADMREGVTLETCGQSLGEFLAQRTDPMAAMAAREIVDNLNLALKFLRDRLLLTAFGVNSLWSLVAVAGAVQAASAGGIQARVDRGRAGQAVLLWLANHYQETMPQLEPGRAEHAEVIAAAQRWLSARPAAAPSPAAPALPIAV